LVVSATLVAVTITMVPAETLIGTERTPADVIVPADAVQVTAVFVVFRTLAAQVEVCPWGTDVGEHEALTETGGAVTVTVAVAALPLASVPVTTDVPITVAE
jgi:hypothetical protein